MKESYYADVKSKFLGKSFDYLVKNGLENTSLRELCKETNISLGSVYYWFDGKEEMFIDATEFGMKRVSEEIFEYAFENMNDLEGFIDSCVNKVRGYTNELRFICQTASSPIYGERLRKVAESFVYKYDKYCFELSKKAKCNFGDVKPVIYLLVSAIFDYIIWDNEEKMKEQIEYVKKQLRIIGE